MTKSVLSEKTLMPVSFVVMVVGVVVWLVSVAAKVEAQANAIDRIQTHNRDADTVSLEIMKRLERIDTKVDFLYEAARAKQR